MRTALTIAVVLLGVPALALCWMYASGRKCVIVRNESAGAISVELIDSDGSYVERTEPEEVASQGFTWIIFRPEVKGGLTAACAGGAGFATVALGSAQRPAPMFSAVSFKACNGRAPVRRTAPQAL